MRTDILPQNPDKISMIKHAFHQMTSQCYKNKSVNNTMTLLTKHSA